MDSWRTNISSILDKTNNILTTPVYTPDNRTLYISPYDSASQSDFVHEHHSSPSTPSRYQRTIGSPGYSTAEVFDVKDDLERFKKDFERFKNETHTEYDIRTDYLANTIKKDLMTHVEAMKLEKNNTQQIIEDFRQQEHEKRKHVDEMIALFQSQIDELSRSRRESNFRADKNQTMVDTLIKSLNANHKTINDLMQTKQEVTCKLDDTCNSVVQITRGQSTQQKQIEQLMTAKQDLTAKVQEHSRIAEEITSSLNDNQRQLQDLMNNKKDVQSKIKENNTCITQLQSSLQINQKQIQDLTSARNQLQKQVQDLTSTKNQLQENVTSNQYMIEQLSKMLNDTNAQVLELTTHKNQHMVQLKDQQSCIQQLTKTVQSNQTQISQLIDDKHDLLAKTDSNHMLIQQALQKMESHQEHENKIVKSVLDVMQRVDKVEQDVSNWQEQINMINKSMQQTHARNSTLIDALTKRISMLETTVQSNRLISSNMTPDSIKVMIRDVIHPFVTHTNQQTQQIHDQIDAMKQEIKSEVDVSCMISSVMDPFVKSLSEKNQQLDQQVTRIRNHIDGQSVDLITRRDLVNIDNRINHIVGDFENLKFYKTELENLMLGYQKSQKDISDLFKDYQLQCTDSLLGCDMKIQQVEQKTKIQVDGVSHVVDQYTKIIEYLSNRVLQLEQQQQQQQQQQQE
ncbi:laminin subunit alpha [Acrasis kona]|uniref:Laminin subunit alpha n=1 Tax=Acrasis kona TaxID=1008807 RepID=A0AAW2ZK27_9EUKA